MNEPIPIHLTRDELRKVIAEGVHDAFLKMGIQVDDPIAMQRDFQHLRDWRTAQESLKARGRSVMIGVLVTGLLALLWVGFKDTLLLALQPPINYPPGSGGNP